MSVQTARNLGPEQSPWGGNDAGRARSTGSELLVRQLHALGVEHFFFVIGGPMSDTIGLAIDSGLKGIDTRDERAATFAAIAYARMTGRPGVVVSCSGPGTTNTVTGLAHANADGTPVIMLGGSAARYLQGTGGFQELDQVTLMRPVTKLSHQAADPDGVPEALTRAFQVATAGAPGPVYLDLPSDVLYGTASGEHDPPRQGPRPRLRSAGDPDAIAAAVDVITQAERPVIVFGSGVLWSGAGEVLRVLVERTGIPFYPTPMARGIIADDHPLSFPASRSTAFRETDCMIVIGTRDNYVLNQLKPPVVNANAAVVELNLEPADLSRNRLATVAIAADARLGLGQLARELDGRGVELSLGGWTRCLAEKDSSSRAALEALSSSDAVPIHPQRLCAEIDRARDRSSVVIIDGAAILDFGRRALTACQPARFMTPGVFGTMGVGVPFGLGAKIADPSAPVIVLSGDGAFGYHAMELDTAVRHRLGVVIVVANNGGWTSKRGRPGYALDVSDYHEFARAFGCFGAKVTDPRELSSTLALALDYAARESKPALINVIISTDRLGGRGFSRHARHSGGEYDAA
jgi:thiamine pyrophosphate-dependent acetolactate synthase large subunit-like protein